jgi:Family of unknown function (DUF5681)
MVAVMTLWYSKAMDDSVEIMPAEVRAPQQRVIGRPFQPGVSGNPAGRPKGARSRHGENFLAAFNEDFQKHGAEVIAKVRIEQPAVYLKIAADLLPKEMALMVGSPSEFAAMQTAEEIVAKIREEMGDRAANLLQELIDDDVGE